MLVFYEHATSQQSLQTQTARNRKIVSVKTLYTVKLLKSCIVMKLSSQSVNTVGSFVR